MNHAFRLTRGQDLKKEIIAYCQNENIMTTCFTSGYDFEILTLYQ